MKFLNEWLMCVQVRCACGVTPHIELHYRQLISHWRRPGSSTQLFYYSAHQQPQQHLPTPASTQQQTLQFSIMLGVTQHSPIVTLMCINICTTILALSHFNNIETLFKTGILTWPLHLSLEQLFVKPSTNSRLSVQVAQILETSHQLRSLDQSKYQCFDIYNDVTIGELSCHRHPAGEDA